MGYRDPVTVTSRGESVVHFTDASLTIHCGDVLSVLRDLDDGSVRCVVTSPPYWGLRDYGTGAWDGGDPECDHLGDPVPTRAGFNERYFGRESSADNKQDALRQPFRDSCGKCGAIRRDSQLGLESTPEEYVANLVAVFREVRRVLADDGTLWLNLGDSYAGGGGFSPNAPSNLAGSKQTTQKGAKGGGIKPQGVIKAKDLVGIPWRVAFALQADGWYLRSDIIWQKPNPMPESVRDRPTKAHEYVFLLTKSPRYFYDSKAVVEDAVCARVRGPALHPDAVSTNGNGGLSRRQPTATRNRRSVWTITTKPYKGAHFATFPPDLPEICVKAGTAEDDTVLDPFAGSGTVGLVANNLGRNAVLIDLNPEYCDLAVERCGRGGVLV